MNRSGSAAGQSVQPSTTTFKPLPKYVSKFKAATAKIDDAIINTIILGKLNKFSPQNYDEIKSFLCQILDSGQTDFLKDFMNLVFQKATSEEIFCGLYAKLLSELSSKYTFLISKMVVLYKEYMSIFEDLTVEENTTGSYEEFVASNIHKKYRLGYSQFLAELIKNNIIDNELFLKTVKTIADQIPVVAADPKKTKLGEEYADCLVRIVRAINNRDMFNAMKEIIEILKPFTEKTPGNNLTMKARFALLDVVAKVCKE